jgi:hypothetical protein
VATDIKLLILFDKQNNWKLLYPAPTGGQQARIRPSLCHRRLCLPAARPIRKEAEEALWPICCRVSQLCLHFTMLAALILLEKQNRPWL